MEPHQNNIEKMTTFIFHEAKEKADEIRIKAHEEYNIEKAKIVKQETDKLELVHSHRIKDAEIRFKRQVGLLKAKSKMEYMEKKIGIVNDLFAEVTKRLMTIETGEDLFIQALETLQCEEVIIYCNDKVRLGNINNIRYEVKPLDKKYCGGVIIETCDGKTRCDNSYRARIDVFRGRCMDLVANRLFFKRNK